MAEPMALASGTFGKVVAFRLTGGTKLVEAIRDVAINEGIRSGVILSGAANLRHVRLRTAKDFYPSFPVAAKDRQFTERDDPMELLNINGNISFKDDGEIVVHVHVTASTSRNNPQVLAFGAHLEEGIIYTTGEIIIAEVKGMDFHRRMDDNTKMLELHPVATES